MGEGGCSECDTQCKQPQAETATCTLPPPSWRSETLNFWSRDVETLEESPVSGA